MKQPGNSMITRARAGIVKPNPRHALFPVKSDYTQPKSLKAALRDPRWNGSMGTEICTMHETETWDLVSPHEGQNPVNCGWVTKVKLNADGSVNKLKSRLVARGNEQEEWKDYIEIKFTLFLIDFGFFCSCPDPSLFVYHRGSDVIYLLLYVDDTIVTGNNEVLIQSSQVFEYSISYEGHG